PAEPKPANQPDLLQRENALLKEIHRILLAPGNLPEVLDAILTSFERLYGKHYISVFLLDENTQELYFLSGRGVPVQDVRRRRRLGTDGIVGHAAALGEPLYIADVQTDPRYIPILGDKGEQFRSEFAVPLKVRGQLIGLLNLESTEVDGFPPEVRQLLLSLADSLAIAIDTIRARGAAHLRAQRMALLAEVSGRVSAGLSVSAVLSAILHATGDLFPQWEAGMWLLEPDTQLLRLCVLDPAGSQIVETDLRIPLGSGLAGSVAAQGEMITTEDISTDPRLSPQMREDVLRHNWHAYAAAPLRAEGRTLGVLRVAAHERRSFTPDEKHLLVTLAHQAAWPLARAKLIEELEASRARLKEEKDFARNLVAHAHDPIAFLEPDGGFSWTNDQCNAFTGYSLEEKRRLRLFDLLLPEQRAAAEQHWVQVTQGCACLTELRLRRKDGEVRHALFSLSPIRASDGQLSGVLAIGRDITERQRAEEALRESEEKYRTILKNIEEGYYEVDLAGNFTFFNDALPRMLGYSQDELLGMNNRQYMDAETAKRVYQTFNAVYRTGIPHEGFDYEILTKDGAKKVGEVSISLIRNSSGEPSGFRGIVRDTTEKRQAQLRLAESDRLAALGQLVAGVAHELNNPLQAILGFAELLQRRPGLDTTQQRYLEYIQQESERTKKIVSNLLTFARQYPLEKSRVDLNELLKKLLEFRAHSLHLANVRVETELRPLPSLHADGHRLQQVFLNLLLNAEQALEKIPDGRQLLVSTELDATPKGQAVRVTLRDTGPGISREDRSRIFEPFFTTKRPGGGTGLGLSIAYSIVREHGGTLELSSAPGRGTTATVILPVVSPELPAASEA
ncbi:MAG: PAS domain S-box protein, partial [Terriglobia bacterium]